MRKLMISEFARRRHFALAATTETSLPIWQSLQVGRARLTLCEASACAQVCKHRSSHVGDVCRIGIGASCPFGQASKNFSTSALPPILLENTLV